MIDQNTPVDYDDAQHLYSIAGRRYVSASQLVEKFTPPFDGPVVAERYAQKNGQTAQYWLDKWAEKNEKSKVRGNRIHNTQEVISHGAMIERIDGKILPVHGFEEEGIPWIKRPDGVYIEKKVWHHGYKIAGRADRIILTGGVGHPQRYANVEDHKTNETLHFTSWQNPKTGNYKMLLPPLGHIMDSNWNHYCLQLSLYMFMLEYQGFLPGNMTVIYYPHPTKEDPVPEKIRYPVPYMKKEVLMMCNFLNRNSA